jgi:hypothetical protein
MSIADSVFKLCLNVWSSDHDHGSLCVFIYCLFALGAIVCEHVYILAIVYMFYLGVFPRF